MKTWNMINRRIAFIALLLLTTLVVNNFAQDMAVPANLQAALFKKIFSFNKTLTAKGNVEVAVIGAGSDEVVSAFKSVGVNAKATDQIGGASVVYVMPGTPSPKAQTSSKGVLSISGVTSFVEEGKVAIGLGVEGGKPKIIINMAQLKAEGQELSADLLKIAKVIQ
jgi:hypothetical protein